MVTVAQAFEQFMQGLEPTSRQAAEATRQQQHVFENMRQRLRPKASILSGSYGRNTAVRPLHDIDLFLIFAAEGSPPREAPAQCLDRVHEALRDAYRNKQPKLQRRSVNIVFTESEIGFDVVPAVEDSSQPEAYWIPDRETGTWLRSNPRRHWERSEQANNRAGKKLKPLIKALKHWNGLQGKPVSSFLLEAIAYDAFQAPPKSYPEGLAALFMFASERITSDVPDPAGLGTPINAGVNSNNVTQSSQRLLGAARKATQALQQESGGHVATAHSLWADLLGHDHYRAR